MQRRIEIDRTYTHPPELVWRALTDSEAIAAWLMPNDFEAIVGREFTLRTDPAPGFDGVVNCKLIEIEEPRRMVWSWKGGPIDTTVTFSLEPTSEGTRFRMTQEGFRGLKGVLTSLILGAGCRKVYGKLLPQVLERLQTTGKPEAPVADTDADCKRGFWSFLAFIFSPILGRKERKDPQ